MKRLSFLWVVVALFAVSTANAQFRFGIKGGANIANAKFDKDVLKSDNITGFQLGPMIETMFGKGGIGFDLALLYSQKGAKIEPRTKLKNDYLDVPVNVKFKFGTPLVNPFIAFGPYASFRINGNKDWTISENASSIVNQVKAQSFGAGLNFTAGAELFDHLQVGVTYGWGLTDNYKTFDKNDLDSYKGKLHTWQIHAAFLF
jgi:hypothetical protein